MRAKYGQCESRPGSIYLITLITVAAIVTMVFIGVSLREAQSLESTIVEQMSLSNSGVFDAAELALQTIASDEDWQNSVKKGLVFQDIEVGFTQFTSSVIDIDTGALPTDSTANYRVTVSASQSITRSSASFDLNYASVDYISFLQGISATNYWAMNEAQKTKRANDAVGSTDGSYTKIDIPGQDTNDEGVLVPVFQDQDSYLEVPWTSDFAASNGSISLWMKLTANEKNSTYSVLGMLYEQDGGPSINLSVKNNAIQAYINGDTVFADENFATTVEESVTQNTWHHVTMTWGAAGLSIYLDGTRRAVNELCTVGLSTSPANRLGEQPLHIGGGYLMARDTQPINAFQGSVAHVSFLPVQLTGAQVESLAAARPDLKELEMIEHSWARVFD